MAIGQYKTLNDFGSWSASDPASSQRALLQAALNSGERILLPVGETVTIDAPVYMDYTTELSGNGNSTIRCDDTQADMLVLRCDRSTVRGIRFVSNNTERTGAGVRVGPKADGYYAIYNSLEHLFFDFNSKYGIHCRKFGGLNIIGGQLQGRVAAVYSDNEVVDSGDSKLWGADLNASEDGGTCFLWESGGGWTISKNKFNLANCHIKIKHERGNTGGITIVSNNLEGNTPISIDILGNGSWFNRLVIASNNIGVLGCAIAVRNFLTNGAPATPWLGGLVIGSNTIQAGQNGSPIMDIGCAKDPIIDPYHIQGNGTAASPVIIRPQCQGGKVRASQSVMVDCVAGLQNLSFSTAVV
jgi:hypothetical protein